MKKLIISICTVLCLMAAPLASVEWGGLLFNESGASTSDFKEITIKQTDGISLWLKSPLGKDSGFYFSSEILYKFSLDIAKGSDPQFKHIFDLPMLKVTGDLNAGAGLLSLNAGRFYYVDATSAVISQVVDGVALSYTLPTVKLGGFLGYTGLLNSLNVPMAVNSSNNNEIYNMADPYLPLGVTIEFPSLIGNQSLEFDAYYIQDLGGSDNNRAYANVILSGPITNALFYNAATSFGFMNFKDLMNYSSFTLLAFPSEKVSLSAGASFGSADGMGPFTAYSSLAATSVLAASKITPKAAFSYTTESMNVDLNASLPLEYTDDTYKIGSPNIGFAYIYNIFSDLQLGFSVNADIDLTGSNAHNINAKLNLALAF